MKLDQALNEAWGKEEDDRIGQRVIKIAFEYAANDAGGIHKHTLKGLVVKNDKQNEQAIPQGTKLGPVNGITTFIGEIEKLLKKSGFTVSSTSKRSFYDEFRKLSEKYKKQKAPKIASPDEGGKWDGVMVLASEAKSSMFNITTGWGVPGLASNLNTGEVEKVTMGQKFNKLMAANGIGK